MPLGRPLLYLVLALLVAEQVLACAAGYHAVTPRKRSAVG
jgi:hypothetical protein